MKPCCICSSGNQNCVACKCVNGGKLCTSDCRRGDYCRNKRYGSQTSNKVSEKRFSNPKAGGETRGRNKTEKCLSMQVEYNENVRGGQSQIKKNGTNDCITESLIPTVQTHEVPNYEQWIEKRKIKTRKERVNSPCEEWLVVQGDGNCFYRCVSMFLHDTQDRHVEIRRKIISTLKKNEQHYSQLINGEFKRYIDRKSKSAGDSEIYAEEAEIFAASENFGIEIYVWTTTNAENGYHRYSRSKDGEHFEKFITLIHDQEHFYIAPVEQRPCPECLSNSCNKKTIKSSASSDNLKWNGISMTEASTWVSNAYDEVVFWKTQNLFEPPKCDATKEMIKMMTGLINQYTNDSPSSSFALKALMITPHLFLQRTHKDSSQRENVSAIKRRIALWNNGELQKLLQEATTRQKRLDVHHNTRLTQDDEARSFGRLIKTGKINPAIRMLSEDASKGPIPISDEVKEHLRDLHPKAKNASIDTKLQCQEVTPDPCIYEPLTEKMVWKKAVKTQGGAGPSGLNSRHWRTMLSKKRFGEAATDLCKAIASLARKLATETCQDAEALTACRLVPLNKNPGVRPIGIGEILRRIIGKCIMEIIKDDVKKAAGNLQVCAGHQAGGEAAIHAMKKVFEEDGVEAVLLIDASNAFNSINREAMLHNISAKCPTLSYYAKNTYGSPANLYISGGKKENNDIIESSEGTTQGDPVAMAMYSVGLSAFLDKLSTEANNIKHAAYADDLIGAGSIDNLRTWWDKLEILGPKFGYYPNAKKSWLIVKPEKYEHAQEIFQGTNIQITKEGQCHLGAVIGSQAYKENHVHEKVEVWVKELQKLSIFAETEPHAAYTAFTFGLKHKWTYLCRTVPDIENLMLPLEECIKSTFIPALTKGHHCTDLERDLLALPPRLGGLGIINPSKRADSEYQNSVKLTSALTAHIQSQNISGDINDFDIKKIRKEITKSRRTEQEEELNRILEHTTDKLKRKILMAQEVGGSSWLTSLPIKAKGFSLNKQEFTDALALRYGWPVEGLPDTCSCGNSFDENHAMVCQKGGFVCIRHDEVRDITAEMLREISQDVSTEPTLLPLTGEILSYKTAKASDEARVDISARGFWTRGQRAFFDVRIFDPLAPSHRSQTLEAAHKKNEREKIRQYSERITNIDHGTFTPLVFTTSGGMGPQAKVFYKRIAELMSEKKGEPKGYFSSWMRCRLSFSLLRSALLCLRGTRSKCKVENITNLDFEDVVSESRIRD